MDRLNQAIALAAEAHDGQTDKGGANYILHPLRVMARMHGDQDRIVAVLHDVAEDCPMYPLQILRKAFGHEVGDALDAITKRAGEPYETYLSRVAANPIARRVKMADIADNSDLTRLGREPTVEDRKRLARYQDAAGYLFSLPLPSAAGDEMTDMVERVARAIARADEQNGGPPYEWRIAQGKHAKEQLFDQARAAIEAMKLPLPEPPSAEKQSIGQAALRMMVKP